MTSSYFFYSGGTKLNGSDLKDHKRGMTLQKSYCISIYGYGRKENIP